MSKVLVIRKQDKTIHISPMENKASLMAYNNKQNAENKFTIEEMDEEEAKKLPYIDESFVSATEAIDKSKALTSLVNQKDAEISQKDAKLEDLKAKLAAFEAGTGATTGAAKATNEGGNPPTALELIEAIKGATTVEEANAIVVEGEERKTVLAALEAKLEDLKAK